MVQQLMVATDGSPESWRAFDVAIPLATRSGSSVRLVHVAADPLDAQQYEAELQLELSRRGPFDVDVSTDVRLTVISVAAEFESLLEQHPGSVIVMSSHGRGRSAALIGSVADEVLRRTFGPIVLVGPHAEPSDFSGPIMVTVDGSAESEAAVPLAAAWAIELRTTPWLLNVEEPTTGDDGGTTIGSSYLARLAHGLHTYSDHPVQFDELHDKHPARAIVDYGERHDASLIVASSHGRSGLSRLAMGSVTAEIVRHATCPVAVIRLPHPAQPDGSTAPESMWAY